MGLFSYIFPLLMLVAIALADSDCDRRCGGSDKRYYKHQMYDSCCLCSRCKGYAENVIRECYGNGEATCRGKWRQCLTEAEFNTTKRTRCAATTTSVVATTTSVVATTTSKVATTTSVVSNTTLVGTTHSMPLPVSEIHVTYIIIALLSIFLVVVILFCLLRKKWKGVKKRARTFFNRLISRNRKDPSTAPPNRGDDTNGASQDHHCLLTQHSMESTMVEEISTIDEEGIPEKNNQPRKHSLSDPDSSEKGHESQKSDTTDTLDDKAPPVYTPPSNVGDPSRNAAPPGLAITGGNVNINTVNVFMSGNGEQQQQQPLQQQRLQSHTPREVDDSNLDLSPSSFRGLNSIHDQSPRDSSSRTRLEDTRPVRCEDRLSETVTNVTRIRQEVGPRQHDEYGRHSAIQRHDEYGRHPAVLRQSSNISSTSTQGAVENEISHHQQRMLVQHHTRDRYTGQATPRNQTQSYRGPPVSAHCFHRVTHGFRPSSNQSNAVIPEHQVYMGDNRYDQTIRHGNSRGRSSSPDIYSTPQQSSDSMDILRPPADGDYSDNC